MWWLLPLLKFGGLGAGLGGILHLVSTLRHQPLSSDWLSVVSQVAQQVAQAVEQSDGQLGSDEKKQLAETVVTEILSHMGITVPAVWIDTAIEAAVLAINRGGGGQTVTQFAYDAAGNLLGTAAAAPQPAPPNPQPSSGAPTPSDDNMADSTMAADSIEAPQ